MTPYFSIITVTFNAEEAVRTTIASIRRQTFKNYEWIVVDGASEDSTVAIARKHLTDRDKLISERDEGIYDAMNKGLSISEGRFVNFLNAGDSYADTDVLEEIYHASRDVEIIYGDSLLALPDGLMRYRRAGPVARSITKRMPFWHQSMFTKRRMHLAHRFDTSFRISADYAAIASMFMAGARMRYLRRPVNINPIRPESASVRGLIPSAKEDYRVRTEILGQPKVIGIYRLLRKLAQIAIVRLLRSIPEKALTYLIPEPIRRRLY